METNFDSNYSIKNAQIEALGGTPSMQFDSVYSQNIEILRLLNGISGSVIDDSSVSLNTTWSSSKIYSELANAGFDTEIVQELPSIGDVHTIYFILNSNPSTGDTYDEYMYINGAWEKVGNTGVDLSDYATINYVDEQIASLAGTANSEFDGKTTEDFSFVQTLPVAGEEDLQVVIKGENIDTLYKYVSGVWVEQTPNANILYFDIENEALYSYISADHQFAPISTVDTIIVGKNLNTNVALKNVKTAGVYNVLQRTSSASKGEYTKKWTLTVEGVDYDEYELTDSVYQKLQSNYTIQKRTWSSSRHTNDGWTNFATYYAGEIKDSTVSKYYTWSSYKINASLGAKADVYEVATNADVDAIFNNPAPNEIYYTSSDGNIVTPSTTSALPTIVSNTYYSKGKIKFASELTSIGNRAFRSRTNLTSVTIPNSVTSIGDEAFDNCSGIISVTIGNSVTHINYQSFSGCSFISVNIPNSVTIIGDEAFSVCRQLTSVTIPNSVTSIGLRAFYECTRLTDIVYNGTVAEWNNITFGNYWHDNVPATVVHCTDGDVNL